MYFFVSFLSSQVLYEDNEMTVSITSDHILRLHLTASVSFHIEFFFWVSYSLDSSNKQKKNSTVCHFPIFLPVFQLSVLSASVWVVRSSRTPNSPLRIPSSLSWFCLLSVWADGKTGRSVLSLQDFGSHTIGLRFGVQTLFCLAGKLNKERKEETKLKRHRERCRDGTFLQRAFAVFVLNFTGVSWCRVMVC